jgi:hypothetical protein
MGEILRKKEKKRSKMKWLLQRVLIAKNKEKVFKISPLLFCIIFPEDDRHFSYKPKTFEQTTAADHGPCRDQKPKRT